MSPVQVHENYGKLEKYSGRMTAGGYKESYCEAYVDQQSGKAWCGSVGVDKVPGIQKMIRSGDVFLIKTSKGDACFQYVKKIPPMGTLIRVIPGVVDDSVVDFESHVNLKTNFWIFFPVAAALKCGIIRKIKNMSIPEHASSTPLFRAGIVDPATKRVETWWLWDGEKEWMVGEITAEQRKLPIRQAWNDTLLIQRIEEGWLPERDKF